MRWASRTIGILVLAVAATAANAQSVEVRPSSDSGDGKQLVFEIDWADLTAEDRTLRPDERVDANSVVAYRVKGLNYFAYTLRAEVEEEVVESYVTLERLWSQLLGIPTRLAEGVTTEGTGGTANPVQEAFAAWEDRIRNGAESLQALLESYDGVSISPERRTELDLQIPKYETDFKEDLQELRTHARRAIIDHGTSADRPEFRLIDEAHSELLSAIDDFARLARLIIDGERRPLGKKKAGTIVTVTLTPTERNGTNTEASAVLEYFVHSQHPLEFHLGIVASGLDQLDFETVRALNGQDLFVKVRDQNETADLVTFLSYRLKSWGGEDQIALMASLGTAFDDPGDTLYLGLSGKLSKRFVITLGAASGTVAETGTPILEMAGDRLEARELFDEIDKRRAWAGFFGISFSVF